MCTIVFEDLFLLSLSANDDGNVGINYSRPKKLYSPLDIVSSDRNRNTFVAKIMQKIIQTDVLPVTLL